MGCNCMSSIHRKSILFLHLLLQCPIDTECAQHRLSLQVCPGQTSSTKWSIPSRAYWKLSDEMLPSSSVHWEDSRKWNLTPALKINYSTFLFDFAAVNDHQGLTQKFYTRLGSTVLWLTPIHVYCFLSLSCSPNDDLLIGIVRQKYYFPFKEGKPGEDDLWLAFRITKNVTETWQWSI